MSDTASSLKCRCCGSMYVYRCPDDVLDCRSCGLIATLLPKTTVVYDEQYVAERYDRYPTTDAMSVLRADVMETVLRLHEALPSGKPDIARGAILDVGYGNGSFIRECLRRGWDAYGCDVNPGAYEGVRKVLLPVGPMKPARPYRVVTFFDSLEHFEGLSQVRQVSGAADWLFLSYPQPPEGFPDTRLWKHYRPGEHHMYFRSPRTLEAIFTHGGRRARVVYTGDAEDSIRGRLPDGSQNISSVMMRVTEV